MGSTFLAIEPDLEAWFGALPRVAAVVVGAEGVGAEGAGREGAGNGGGGPCFLGAMLRVEDEAALAVLERELGRGGSLSVGERARRAGLPGPPPRRELRHELMPYVWAYDALLLEVDSPLGLALELADSGVPLVARLAQEHLATRPHLLATLGSALAQGSAPPMLILRAMARRAAGAGDEEARALSLALGARVTALLPAAFEHEAELDASMAVLAALGEGAAPARDAVVALGQSELAGCRSTLRDCLARILGATQPR